MQASDDDAIHERADTRQSEQRRAPRRRLTRRPDSSAGPSADHSGAVTTEAAAGSLLDSGIPAAQPAALEITEADAEPAQPAASAAARSTLLPCSAGDQSQSGPHTDRQVLQAEQAILSAAQLADTQVHVPRSAAVAPSEQPEPAGDPFLMLASQHP